MTVAGDLDSARAALQMINPAPYNAEAPPQALVGDITPTEFHYVRSNFALPTHDGTLEIGGAVGKPMTLTLDDLRALPVHEQAVTLECAGNGRLEMRPLPTGEPWGDYAVSTARWTGALLSDVLALAGPAPEGVDVRFQGADHGPYHLAAVLGDSDQNDLTFVRALPLAVAADPSSAILVAYLMNGEPLRADHGSPFRLIVPHWYAVASVKWLKHIDVLTEPYTGEFQTGHYIYQWPDRAHEPVTVMRVRARITDPAPGAVLPARTMHDSRKGMVGQRPDHARRHRSHRRGGLASGAGGATQGPLPVAGLVIRLGGRRRRAPHSACPRDRCCGQRPARRPALEPAWLWQQRHRSPLRRSVLITRRSRARSSTLGSEGACRDFRAPKAFVDPACVRSHC